MSGDMTLAEAMLYVRSWGGQNSRLYRAARVLLDHAQLPPPRIGQRRIAQINVTRGNSRQPEWWVLEGRVVVGLAYTQNATLEEALKHGARRVLS